MYSTLDLWGMVFHAMVAFCLEVDFLLNSISTCCEARMYQFGRNKSETFQEPKQWKQLIG